MKHCPNPNCPFLKEYKLVAEFSDDVELCVDCGTPLVAGDAPDVVLAEPTISATTDQPSSSENFVPDLVMLCAVDSEADADFYKAQLEFQDIPVAIVRQTGATEDNADVSAIPLFELQVRRSDLMRATYLLDTLAADEADDIESDTDELDTDELDTDELDTEVYEEDEEDDEADRQVSPAWSGVNVNDETERAAPIGQQMKIPSSGRAAHATPVGETEADVTNAKPANRFNQTLLLILVGIIIILVVWFLLNR